MTPNQTYPVKSCFDKHLGDMDEEGFIMEIT